MFLYKILHILHLCLVAYLPVKEIAAEVETLEKSKSQVPKKSSVVSAFKCIHVCMYIVIQLCWPHYFLD